MPAFTARALILALLILHPRLTSTAVANDNTIDLQGDIFGAAAVTHDIASLSAVVSPTAVSFVVDFYNGIAPPSDFEPSSVVGFIDIDIDQNEATGTLAKKSEFSPNGDSHLGADYRLVLFSERFHAGQVEVVDANTEEPVGLAPIVFDAMSFSIALPLNLIGGDGLFNYGLIVGDYLSMSDEAPNNGFRTTVPEPSSAALTLAACGALAAQMRKRQSRCR